MYKQQKYSVSILAFGKAELLAPNDAQLQYNLALANFKVEMYSEAVEHLKKCIQIDNRHPYAYNNLAFIYNMHCLFRETIQICLQAKEYNRHGHKTHRHWAFAEFKEGNLVKAVRKIRKGVIKDRHSAENWVVWGLILRTAGKLESALHKFEKAVKLDPKNLAARQELDLVQSLMHFDKLLPTEATLRIDTSGFLRDGNNSSSDQDQQENTIVVQ